MKRVELQVGERKLSSGLTVLAVRNPGVSTIAATIALRVSQLAESEAEHGLAYLVGECLDEGSRKSSGVELSERVEGIGGYLHCASGGATIQCPTDERAKAVRLLREIALEPAFPARELRRVQEEVLAEIESEDSEPHTVASRRFRREVYGDHPFSRPAHGSAEAVKAVRPADLRRFHRKWFTPHDGFAAIAGPIEVEEGLDLLAKVFRSFRVAKPEFAEFEIPPLPAKRCAVHLPMDREQVHVYYGHIGIRRTDPDYYALSVMDHILGSGPGFTSRIARKLRDELGLCYSVYASITDNATTQPSCFEAYLGTSAKHRRKAIDLFTAEIESLKRELPTAAELEDVHDYLTGNFVLTLERNVNLIRYAIACRRFGLGYDYLERYPELIRAVTREEVQRVAQERLHPERRVVVSAGAGKS